MAIYERPSMVEVQKKDLRRLFRLAEDMKANDVPYSCPDIDETISILRRVLHMDRFDKYEPLD